MFRILLAGLLLFSATAYAQDKSPAPAQEKSPAPVTDLNFFAGKWSCNGKFVKSGKEISADVSFEPVLDGKWIMFRHDDRPPFSYHAIAEWGWDAKKNAFVSTVQDSAGGLRLFHSSGWSGQKLTWDGGDLTDSQPNQRFEFDRLGTDQFKVTYSVQKDGQWHDVDASTCKKSGV